MNNVFTRLVGLFRNSPIGSVVFEEAEYFAEPRKGIFMRTRNGDIYQRATIPGEGFVICFRQNDAWPWAKDWGWANTGRLWLPRGCRRISEEEAAQPPPPPPPRLPRYRGPDVDDPPES